MSRSALLHAALAVALIAASAGRARAVPPEDRTQFVLLSMDTTPSGRPIALTDFGRILRRLNREGAQPPAAFTLFIATGGLQLDPATRRPGPRETPFLGRLPRNRPTMRYARDAAHLHRRVGAVRELLRGGVEIGSHAVRHEHGREWTADEWQRELDDHSRILDLLGIPHPRGFRAPFLEHNEAMYTALAPRGYLYDVSTVGDGAWPTRDAETGVWRFAIPSVRLEGHPSPVLLFDDNLERVMRGMARAEGVSGEAAIRAFADARFESALRGAFARRYSGNRDPLLISGHGGLITPTLRFMERVCHQPHVRCATFSEAVRYLEAHPELAGVRE